MSRRSFFTASLGLLGTATIKINFVCATEAKPTALSYPSRSVKWVVPYTAGGATDVISRLVCQQLSETLKQPFLVANEPGAGADVGTQSVINSPPDGYTLLLISTANAINASFDKTLPFDFVRGIIPIAGLARIPLVMVINNDIPAHTISEFVAYARAHVGKLNFASSGVGTSLHLSGELFKAMTGIAMTHVPYKGSAPALMDLMSGHVQVMFDNVTSSEPLIREGKIRALGVSTHERSALLPEIAPISDTLSGYDTSSFYGLGAPRLTPTSIVEILNKAMNEALDVPDVARQFTALGAIMIKGDRLKFAAMLEDEIERWRKIVAVSGVSKD